MSETKDPAIKLFGKTIPLPEIAAISGNDSSGAPSSIPSSACGAFEENNNNHTDKNPPSTTDSLLENRDGEDREVEKDTLGGEISETKQKDGSPTLTSEDCAGPDATSGINENPKTPTIDNEAATLKSSRTEEDQSDTGGSQEKTLKKPDKILPCPRCNSMDTKFCYYNNYNVNQPRHFCKNCQRYWTAGGTMRNVPVGAGRRKNKNSSSHYRHITVCETLQTARSEVPNGIHHPTLKPNGTVLTFGSDIPLCESMASVLNLAEKTMRNCTQNGFHKPDELKIPVSYGGGENGDDKLNGSSVTSLSSIDEAGKTGMQEAMMRNCQGLPPQIPCFPSAPWPYPWNSAQWSPPVPPPAFCHSGYPMPFYSAAAYWGCAVPGTWNVPWHQQPSSPNQQASNSGPNSPTLGKHSRDENLIKSSNPGEEESSKESKSERCLWIPKTLRIDDPGEAAKSSIWATLGIKNERGDMISGGGLFKSFQSKGDERNCVAETSPVLQANPAALSRSLNFQESS